MHLTMNSQEGPYGPAGINTVDSLNPLLPASWSSDRFAKVRSVVTSDMPMGIVESTAVDSKRGCVMYISRTICPFREAKVAKTCNLWASPLWI